MIDTLIDISHHNGPHLDFAAAAAAGINGVIQKATQGVAGIDPSLSANRTGILAAGLLFGSYHFGTDQMAALRRISISPSQIHHQMSWSRWISKTIQLDPQ